MTQQKKILCIDFDGVLHSYRSGWQGAGVIPDSPVPGAIAWLRALVKDGRFDVCIYSSRSKEPEGLKAMQHWIAKHSSMDDTYFRTLKYPTQKPAAFVTIDDRAITFDGVSFPSPDDIAAFQSWYETRPEPEVNDPAKAAGRLA